MTRAVLFCMCLAAPAWSATLRPFVSLTEPVVRLSDLFERAGPDVTLGPAPAPGGRIVVEAAQLSAIARQFGVDWRPATPADRAVLDRPGRPLGRDDVMGPLRAALQQAGVARDADLELPALAGPMLPVGAPAQVKVVQLDVDAATGRFTSTLSVHSAGLPAAAVRVSGRAVAMVEVPVPRRRMAAGDVVALGDLDWARMRAGQVQGAVVRDPSDALGLALRRSVQPGQPIPTDALGRPMVVTKGMALLLTLDSPGIQVTAQGVAMEPAGVGERVRVKNPLSSVVVEAEVTGPGRARVVPGSAPVRQAAVR